MIIDYVARGYRFENELSMITQYIEECNVLMSYKIICDKLDKVNNDYRYIETKKEIISYITNNVYTLTQ